MQIIKCELCGSNELEKLGDHFICRYCQTRYSPEEAKNLIVQVDKTEEAKRLRIAAHKALAVGNTDLAREYYKDLLAILTDDWEAYFYTTILDAVNCHVSDIPRKSSTVIASLDYALDSIARQSPSVQAQLMSTVCISTVNVATSMYQKAQSIHPSRFVMAGASKYQSAALQMGFEEKKTDYRNSVNAIINVYFALGDELEEHCNLAIEDNLEMIASAYSTGLAIALADPYVFIDRRNVHRIEEKIRRYNPNYRAPSNVQASCYIATAVYGSYDCPEVWVLRRFRDYSLKKTKPGRAFIKLYYAVSPRLVQRFGQSKGFGSINRVYLDRFVVALRNRGYAATRYYDQQLSDPHIPGLEPIHRAHKRKD